MEQKKVLKKLTLNKEEIVNLNDFEMRNLKGGTGTIIGAVEDYVTQSSNLCVNELTAYTQQAANTIYNGVVNAYNYYTNNMGDTSRVIAYGGCLISGVTVKP